LFIKELPVQEHHYQPFSLLFIKELAVPEEEHHYQLFSL
jgi:hypothetical protein